MSAKSITDKYTQLSPIEHCLARPDTYLGSAALIEDEIFINDIESCTPCIVKKKIVYIQALERIYEEVLLNAYDRTIEDPTCTEIRVDIDSEQGIISVMNNGEGIPVLKKEELGCYIAEMIFGRLRTGTNYDDNKKRVTGGRNGLGAKLSNIFSTQFQLETIDSQRRKHYLQTWSNNMGEVSSPTIKSSGGKKPFTRIMFAPDLPRFNIERMSDDIVMLMKKRLIDIGFASHAGVKTYFNGTLISIKKPEDYMKLYHHPEEGKFIIDATNERWSVGVALSDSGYQHAAFVNGIHTSLGGSHLDHVVNQITKEIIDKLKAKKIVVKPSDVKNRLFVFVRSSIENPTFDSQSKECLKMNKKDFGSEYIMSDAFRKKIISSSILKSMTEVSDSKKVKDLQKTGGIKTSRLNDLPTLEDASWAGTSRGLRTKLILTEGLSARTFAISALNVIGRECYGVFPLKGKLLNVRNVSITRVAANEEIKNIVKILGLKYELKYDNDEDMNTLRYGGIVSLTDSDADGYHISGLLINLIHHFWPSLIGRGFISFCITPIVKVFKGGDVLEFYTLGQYEEWMANAKGSYRTKYFKGLGTSTAAEARDALKDIDQKLIQFQQDDQCDEHMSLAFNTKRADDRKKWLMERYDPSSSIDRNERTVGVSDFINYELSHFSTYDCLRSIPCIMDGAKPSQRKIIYTAMKYATKHEIKVAQLAPKVAELTDYHHGEVSLMGAIINLAQTYVGSNNINLLEPLGAFGSRLSMGADAASPRYIFTKTSPITTKLFDQRDNALLKYLQSDGAQIEPEWFAPVLPMVLINGALGIGTGFSTSVLKYDPRDLANYITLMLNGKTPTKDLMPWYKGFTGSIELTSPGKYSTYGVWKFIDKKRCLHITDLPINTSTDGYKEFCEDMLKQKDSVLDDVLYGNTDVIVDFKLVFNKDSYARIKAMHTSDLAKEFKLVSKISASNMYLFNADGRIEKYADIYTIIDYYYHKRLALYVSRKAAMMEQLQYEMMILSNRAKFIDFVKKGKIDQRAMSEGTLLEELVRSFEPDSKSTGTDLGKYSYLIDMAYKSFTNENAMRMKKNVKEKMAELESVQSTSPERMWIADIDSVVAMLK
jgi:DNA topoisomerase-2